MSLASYMLALAAVTGSPGPSLPVIQSVTAPQCIRFTKPLGFSASGVREVGDEAWYVLKLGDNRVVTRPLFPGVEMWAGGSRWRAKGDSLQIRVSNGLVGWDISLRRRGDGFVGVATYLTDVRVAGAVPTRVDVSAARIKCPTLSQAQKVFIPSKNLFNGKDLTGWHVDVPADSNVRVRNPFIVRNGMLVSLGEPRGHLITDSSFRDYRLVVDYRFPAAPGNAGVLVHASTPRALYGMFPESIEVQMEHGNAGDFWCIVEDIRVPDMERRRGPRADWGITEGKGRRIINLTDSSEKPLGEWNIMVIEAVGRSIKVWLNGDLVNDGSDATADHGRIAVQSEGSEVEFRQIVLTPIGGRATATTSRETTGR
jgi:hypothetical protein